MVKKLNIFILILHQIGVPRHSFTILEECKFVTITGIGFWDYIHVQKGMAGNGKEIHPVLSIGKR